MPRVLFAWSGQSESTWNRLVDEWRYSIEADRLP